MIENKYTPLQQTYLRYAKLHEAGVEGCIYDRYYNFLIFTGFTPEDAAHETALFANTVADLMD